MYGYDTVDECFWYIGFVVYFRDKKRILIEAIMKKSAFIYFILVVSLHTTTLNAQSPKPSPQPTYTNPLSVDLADPYVLHVKGDKYYLYGTGGAKNGFAAYSSTDLVNWKNEGQVYFHDNKNGWSDPNAAWNGAYWAPEVYAVNGKYYMFYSAQWKENPGKELENFRIGVAVADQPTGPFIDVTNKPVFDPGYPVIDANVLFDTNGKVYLYYSRCCYKHPVESEIADWAKNKGWFNEIEESWVYGVEMKPDFSGVIGEPVLLLRPPVSMKDKQAAWESRSVTLKEVNRRWTEGSTAFKKGDTYYMMYSANYFGGKNYAVGYATAKSPLGPFTKAANNPVLQKNVEKGGVVTGTGHNSITYSPDGNEMFCVYHGRTSQTGDKRVVFIDRMTILPNGKLVVKGPTTAPQPVPSGITKSKQL
jgi:beta-xylosidase